MLDFQFLGTSGGVPSVFRKLTGLMIGIQNSNDAILVDCGEGSQNQILRSKFSLARINLILITHLHGDHIFGLPGLLATRSLLGCQKPIHICGPRGIKEFIEQALKASFSNLQFPLSFDEFELSDCNENGTLEFNIPSKSCPQAKTWIFEAIPMDHNVPSFSYRIRQKRGKQEFLGKKAIAAGIPPGPLYAKLRANETITCPKGNIYHGKDFLAPESKPLAIVVGGDNSSPRILDGHLDHVDILIHEATLTEEDKLSSKAGKHHSSFESVAQIAENCNVASLVLTHFSTRYHKALEHHPQQFEDRVRSKYQGQFFLANDLDHFRVKEMHGTYHLERGAPANEI